MAILVMVILVMVTLQSDWYSHNNFYIMFLNYAKIIIYRLPNFNPVQHIYWAWSYC